MSFLPITYEEMKARGWDQPDFVYVIGDAYVDHPSFGHAIISRVLEQAGYKVAICSQPDWKDPQSVNLFGTPKLGYLVCGGNMDSMVNHYSVTKHRRKTDAYTNGGEIGKRPDYATIVYCNLIRQTHPKIPIIIGGIEASLRRLAHYDYWSEKMKRSILLDAQADLLIYGMGERAIVEVADALRDGWEIRYLHHIDGTVYRSTEAEEEGIVLPSYEELCKLKKSYAQSFYTQYCNTDPFTARRLIEPYGKEFVVQNPPQRPLTTEEMDAIYALPYENSYHPSYDKGIPAIAEVQFSLVSCRGCFGACSFCALTFHQGRIIQSRSHDSIVAEAERIIKHPEFKGYIHDVGGPTANFRAPACDKQLSQGACQKRQCLFPTPCKNMRVDHQDYVNLLRRLRALPGVKKVFVRSGIRFDYLVADQDPTFFRELVEHHVSGQLKVAPEHISDQVLKYMGKPRREVYQKFCHKYEKLNQQLGKKQFLVPYLMSSHPGSGLKEAIELAEYIRDIGHMPEQVQDFYPTPSTLSTVMYYTGLDPRTMEKVYVPTDPHEKAMQRALIQFRNPKNYHLVREALEKAGRTDLIGHDKKCLIRPRKGEVMAAPTTAAKPSAKAGAPSLRSPGKPAKPQKPLPKGKKEPKQTQPKGKSTPKLPTPLQMQRAEQYLKKRKKK